MKVLTESLCPVCFQRIPAQIVNGNDGNVYLEKTCPSHGFFKTIIWRDSFTSWYEWDQLNDWEPERYEGIKYKTVKEKGCPFDCGLCPQHLRKACFVVLEVTNKCNLKCPVCFASAGERYSYEPDLDTINSMYRTILEYECGLSVPSIQLSGGEPTIRDDLPEIIAMGKEQGLHHIIVNTNGIRIAKDLEFTRTLKQSGLDALYLQFDGVSDDVYVRLRGTRLFRYKVKAIENCAKVNIGVILVPTVVKNVNLNQVGDIIKFAQKYMPTVRGIMFQPISYFGRYPNFPENDDRITIPDMLRAIEKQTNGKLRAYNFVPIRFGRGCEAHCGFACLAVVDEDGITPLTYFPEGGDIRKIVEERKKFQGVKHVRELIKRYWGSPQSVISQTCLCKPLSLEQECISIAGMLFQDAWNIDVRRLKKCCIHVVTPRGRLIPFCAFNVTNVYGKTLYRHQELSGGQS